jgi:hypothetical protein
MLAAERVNSAGNGERALPYRSIEEVP